MPATADLASLRAMGRPFVTTRDAAVRLGLSVSAASHLLRRLTEAGMVRSVRRGLWAIDPEAWPMQLAAWVVAPYPAYVSLWSALHAHGMLSQIPRETHLVSLARPQRLQTGLGTVVIHQVAPEAFGGYATRPDGVALATPSKAIFDLAYLSATHGKRFQRLPEIRLGRDYRRRESRAWAARIPSRRIRTITLTRIEGIERDAEATGRG